MLVVGKDRNKITCWKNNLRLWTGIFTTLKKIIYLRSDWPFMNIFKSKICFFHLWTEILCCRTRSNNVLGTLWHVRATESRGPFKLFLQSGKKFFVAAPLPFLVLINESRNFSVSTFSSASFWPSRVTKNVK